MKELKQREWLLSQTNGHILKLYIRPGASKTEIVGEFGDPKRLKLRVKAPPIEGKANKEIISFISQQFSIRKQDIKLIRGSQSRQKDYFLSIELEVYFEMLIILDKKLQTKIE